jgi:hypothetical protein
MSGGKTHVTLGKQSVFDVSVVAFRHSQLSRIGYSTRVRLAVQTYVLFNTPPSHQLTSNWIFAQREIHLVLLC